MLVERLLQDRLKSQLHEVRAELGGVLREVLCEGNIRNIPGKSGSTRQYWVLALDDQRTAICSALPLTRMASTSSNGRGFTDDANQPRILVRGGFVL